MTSRFLMTMLAVAGGAALLQAQNKVDIVKTVGCLRERAAGEWMLVAATDPEISNANAPPKNEVPAAAPAGTHEFKLIGVSEFNLPAYRNHTVLIKALFVKATPVNRLNITSLTDVLPTCAPSVPK